MVSSVISTCFSMMTATERHDCIDELETHSQISPKAALTDESWCWVQPFWHTLGERPMLLLYEARRKSWGQPGHVCNPSLLCSFWTHCRVVIASLLQMEASKAIASSKSSWLRPRLGRFVGTRSSVVRVGRPWHTVLMAAAAVRTC